MRFFRRIAGLLGLARDDGQEVKDQENDPQNNSQTPNNPPVFQESGLPRRGFSVPVQVAAARPHPAPLLLPCTSSDGGVQGLKWYAKRLRIDEDGDVADEFLDEVLSQTSGSANAENEKAFPKFQVKYNTRAANVKTQVMSHDGKIQQCVEYQGRLQWI
ncbi:hypothetical protein Gogos_021133 [Gossypium gossypioides]|uniref:Phospholipid hydroperoxide glutathione peroxidase n=1 Tax=Gossypium gossypioides TaxID=34282 RepID=A0A7J9CXY9_GOSGO|nr:hypothetical protein [Gossypium gossypioides]